MAKLYSLRSIDSFPRFSLFSTQRRQRFTDRSFCRQCGCSPGFYRTCQSKAFDSLDSSFFVFLKHLIASATRSFPSRTLQTVRLTQNLGNLNWTEWESLSHHSKYINHTVSAAPNVSLAEQRVRAIRSDSVITIFGEVIIPLLESMMNSVLLKFSLVLMISSDVASCWVNPTIFFHEQVRRTWGVMLANAPELVTSY